MFVASNNTEPTQPQVLNNPHDSLPVENVRYCYVVRPDQERSDFPMHQHCKVPEIDAELEANGIWSIVAGVNGQTEELHFDINVEARGKYNNRRCVELLPKNIYRDFF